MRIGTLRHEGRPIPVSLEGDRLVELDTPIRDLLAEPDLKAAVEAARTTTTHPHEPDRLGPAIHNPGKILCVGLNYRDHAAELGNEVGEHPEIFMRALTSLAAPFAAIHIPSSSQSLDFEVELALVIGRRAKYVSEASAMDHVAGYAVFNDCSVRDFQNFGSQWIPGKNFDGTGPLGPFIVTADELGDPTNLDVSLSIVNGDGQEETMQSSNTSLMLHPIDRVIAYCSLWTTLEPGDVIVTGTPSGVGMGRTPKRWLAAGETVISRVERVGELKNQVLAEPPRTA